MTLPPHRTGRVPSGDVEIFYRRFGAPGSAAPMVILHGANYYDSYDWAKVASGLAPHGEVVAYDARGFGESSWSPSKDYSLDAQMGDLLALVDHLGWKKTVLVGASRGGGLALLFASLYPARSAALVLVDYYPDIGIRHPGVPHVTTQAIDNKPRIFPNLEAWLATSSRDKDAAPGSMQRARIEMFLKPVEGGLILAKRDPDWMNPIPTQPSAWPTKVPIELDMWQELAKLRMPVLCVTATRSAVGHSEEQLTRMRRDFPQVAQLDIDSGHNVADGAPEALIAGTLHFLEACL